MIIVQIEDQGQDLDTYYVRWVQSFSLEKRGKNSGFYKYYLI